MNFYDMMAGRDDPYIIAELASNHNGDMDLARRMIEAAKAAGADCVKFQSWSKDTIFSRKAYDENRFLADDYRDRTDFTMEQIVEKFSISETELLEMTRVAAAAGIDCASTPFSHREVDFLVEEMKAPFIKIASMDVNNYPFLEYVARKRKPIVISTGLSELHEIDRAIRTIENCGNREIVILHCVSLYPPQDEEVNLRNMDSLRSIYPYPVGFSDHTIGTAIPLAAVARGARVIEKHFTLDKTMFGWDHKVSATPDELATICAESRRIVRSLGTARIMCEENDDRRTAFRRSIVTTRAIRAGEVIGTADIDYKRPGTGIPPEATPYVVGRKARRDLAQDMPFELADLD